MIFPDESTIILLGIAVISRNLTIGDPVAFKSLSCSQPVLSLATARFHGSGYISRENPSSSMFDFFNSSLRCLNSWFTVRQGPHQLAQNSIKVYLFFLKKSLSIVTLFATVSIPVIEGISTTCLIPSVDFVA